MIETTSIPVNKIQRVRGADGEGSVQFQMDPTVKIGTAKVFAVYGKGGLRHRDRGVDVGDRREVDRGLLLTGGRIEDDARTV